MTMRHSCIVTNVASELSRRLKTSQCRVTCSNVRLYAPSSGLYTYPDVMVVCGDGAHAHTVVSPIVVIEVLSDATRHYDLGRKFQFYRTMPSLREYVTVSHEAPRIVQWTRNSRNTGLLRDIDDVGKEVELTSIDCTLSLSKVYDKIDWTA
jgi:Uma2 family endonuclease